MSIKPLACGVSVFVFAIEQQLVLEGLAATATMHEQVLQLGEPRQVDLSTGYHPSGCTRALAGAKAVAAHGGSVEPRSVLDHLDHQVPTSAGLWWQLIEACGRALHARAHWRGDVGKGAR